MAIFDGHNDLLLNLWLHHRQDPVKAFFSGIENGHLDYPRMQQGGFSGPSAALTTVDKVKSMSDDTWVMLQGNIEQRVGDETYTFRDASGTLTVEIDKKRWNGQTITPKDKVQLEGKVDKDWSNVEVDVKTIKKLP